MNKIKLILILTIIFLLTGCQNPVDSNKIKVVTTIFPYYDFTRAVANDKVDLTMLIKPGADIHSYDPTPLDIAKITNADIFIYTGGDSDTWVEKIIGEIDQSKTKVIRIMDYLDVVIEDEITGAVKEDAPEYDEHVWTSLINAKKITEVISGELIKLDALNETYYLTNSAAYTAKIDLLDIEIKDIVASSTNKELVFGDRFAFRYFADQYGLTYSAAFPGCSTETEPSVATLTYLIKKINTDQIPVILYLEISSQKVADTLAEATGAIPMEINSIQTISKIDFNNHETYISLMKRNVEVLKEALK